MACNRAPYPILRADCRVQADIYYFAVVALGASAYEAAQDKACVWAPCCPTVNSLSSP